MRLKILLAVLLFASLQAPQVLCQLSATTSPTPQVPKNARALLEAAKPYYDFSDPSLKPWHFKASYEISDDKGNESEKGTYEYWWAFGR